MFDNRVKKSSLNEYIKFNLSSLDNFCIANEWLFELLQEGIWFGKISKLKEINSKKYRQCHWRRQEFGLQRREIKTRKKVSTSEKPQVPPLQFRPTNRHAFIVLFASLLPKRGNH